MELITTCEVFSKDFIISNASSLDFGFPRGLFLCQTIVSHVISKSLFFNLFIIGIDFFLLGTRLYYFLLKSLEMIHLCFDQ